MTPELVPEVESFSMIEDIMFTMMFGPEVLYCHYNVCNHHD